MIRGVVKWFNDKKGFGFLNATDVAGDIFVHYSEIQQKGFRTLRESECVEFELFEDEKGKKAQKVRRI